MLLVTVSLEYQVDEPHRANHRAKHRGAISILVFGTGGCDTYILLYKRDMCVQILQGSSAHYLTEIRRFSRLG